MPPKRRVSPAVIGLIVAVGLIIVGLLVWLVILPATRGGGTTDDPNLKRTPVVLKTPSGWGQPLELTGFADTGVTVADAMVGDVIAASDGHVLAAIDLKTKSILWSNDIAVKRLVADEIGDIVVVTDTQQLMVLDALTGQVKGTLQLKDTEKNTVALEGIVLTVDSDKAMVCARDVTSLNVCKWSAQQNKTAGFVFGNNQWFNTNNGVVDWKTGRPAPFGADANTSSDGNHYVAYTIGSASQQVVRIEGYRKDADSDWSYTLQPWDKNKDKPAGQAVSTGNYYWVPGSLIVALSADSHTAKAYSKASGALLWTFDGGGKKLQNGMMVGNTVSFNDSEFGFFAIDAKTGQQKFWAGGATDYYRLSATTGSRILYVVNTTDNQLLAFDGDSASFAQLWTTPLPENSDKLDIYPDANHIYAINTDASPPQLWVLTG